MRLIIIFLLILSTSLFSQRRDSVFIKTKIYNVMYSETLEQPIWLTYIVKCPYGKYPRTGMDFYKNDSIHTSDNNDYINNVYDKGHLAPAASFNCDRLTLMMTFSYLNCTLQNQYLNRGVWKNLEIYERELAKLHRVEVRIQCKFSKSSIKLPTGATVPDGFFKIIKYKNTTLKFYFPNTKPIHTNYQRYRVN